MQTEVENRLLRSGFTADELLRLNAVAARYNDPIETVIDILAKRFRGFRLVTILLLALLVLAVFTASPASAVSFAVAIIFLECIFCFIIPVRLGYKAWRYQKQYIISDRQ